MGIKFKVKLYKDRAGSSGDAAAAGGPTPPPAPSPSHDPAALPTSPHPRQPPPTAIFSYTYEGQDDDDDDWPEDDGTDLDAVQEDEDELPDDQKFYIPLFMSGQKKNLPHGIVRHDSVPLNKNEYFSLWKNWNQLLDGKRTYLRPPRGRRVLSVSGVFRRPLARPWALEFQEPLLDLVEDYPDNDTVQEMIKILCQRYVHFKRTRGDGSCFYRAFFFSYLENLGQIQDSQAEVTRLMEHVAVSRENFCRLKWDKAYFLNPEEYFSSVASELNHLVNSVANGLSSDELQKRSLQEMMLLRVISFLRLLAETEIRTRIDDYNPFIPGKMNVNQYCWKEVRPLDVKASALAMRALTYALGIPLRLETLGEGLTAGGLQVKRLDFFPRSESGKGAFHIVRSYWSSTTTPEPLEIGSGNLISSDGTPLLTLLCRPDNCDILYRK
ncbi:hypothetical protein CFC21_020954 [Triticum aestivum]|uniref:Ubiquitinyl hydrolase 1 n=2 Tax=Triticum aestivum TaxID=4565 RepID=A0A3B6AQR9_WHEAT|nr:OVARIAN TUMOR DOMAIN-containing deubiquitinating enzyme 1-like [Triticum aestivum]KAF7005854.1 hypothetical protein CFC21_020954 [Triticum aestivum]